MKTGPDLTRQRATHPTRGWTRTLSNSAQTPLGFPKRTYEDIATGVLQNSSISITPFRFDDSFPR